MEQELEKSIFNFGMDEETKVQLKGVAFWARINAIISLVTMGLSVLSIILTISILGSSDAAGNLVSRQLVSWCITLLLNILLLGSASSLQKAVDLSDQGALQKGFGQLSRYFKTIGILLIVCTSLVLIIFAFLMMSGGFARH